METLIEINIKEKEGYNMNQKLEKKRGWKRLFSFVLALAMIITLLPMQSMTVYAFEITVNVVAGNKNISLDIEPSDTVESIKEKLAEPSGISIDNQILKFGDTELDNNNNTIADYNIQKGATLTLESKSSSVQAAGSGTEEDPYIISSTAELKGILDGNKAEIYYKLPEFATYSKIK